MCGSHDGDRVRRSRPGYGRSSTGLAGHWGFDRRGARSDGADFRGAAGSWCAPAGGGVSTCRWHARPESNALSTGCQYSGALIQTALDAAYAAGGGTVYAAPGVYCIDDPLIVRSNVYLIGAGVGATILRGKAGSYAGKIVNGAEVYATIAAVAADGASIRDLTVDHATNGTYANGVELVPDGANFGGTPSSNCVVENVQVLGSATSTPTRSGTCAECTTRS